MACDSAVNYELVLIDQSQFGSRRRKFHASNEQPLDRLPLGLLNGLVQFSAKEFRIPINSFLRARYDVLLCRTDRLREGL